MTKRTTQRTTGTGTGRGRAAKGKGMEEGRPAGGAVSGGATATLSVPTHEQIAARARIIWEKRGYPQGQDEQIWLEAERQLKEEAERA